jgi:hypothetical protein
MLIIKMIKNFIPLLIVFKVKLNPLKIIRKMIKMIGENYDIFVIFFYSPCFLSIAVSIYCFKYFFIIKRYM